MASDRVSISMHNCIPKLPFESPRKAAPPAMCESPQASAPTNFFPAWEKAVFTSLFDEDADALRKAIEDPQFDKTAVVRNYTKLEDPTHALVVAAKPSRNHNRRCRVELEAGHAC